MKKPKVSVIIPVHNGAKTLEQCMKSILNQTYKDYEMIIVDNNSNDNTKNIISSFKEKRIKYIFESRIGRGLARNAGINNAKGSIIAMIDSDCIAPKDWLSKLIKPIIQENENIVTGNQSSLKKGFWQDSIQKEYSKLIKKINKGKYISQLDTKNCAIRTNIIKKYMFNPDLGTLEDCDLFLRVRNKYKIRFIPRLKVMHNHKSSFAGMFRMNFERGYNLLKVYQNHKNKPTFYEPSFETISVKKFIMFPPWAIFQFIKNPSKQSLFFLVAGISWYAGIFLKLVLFL